MATLVAIMGETGHGKTASTQYLDPESTFIIDSDRQGLPYKHWKNKYSLEKKNYYREVNSKLIKAALMKINEMLHIKVVVIDTLNAIMVDDEMKRSKEHNYDKWVDLAFSIYDIVTYAHTMRDDLYIVCMFHTEDISDDLGNHFYRILTNGKKLRKVKLESLFNTVLLCKCLYSNDGTPNKYMFETQANSSTAKSPLGLFRTKTIPNNLRLVIDTLRNYETSPDTEADIAKEADTTKDLIDSSEVNPISQANVTIHQSEAEEKKSEEPSDEIKPNP